MNPSPLPPTASQMPDPLPVAGVLPYASAYQYDSSNVWRNGELLIMRQNAALPPRCVKCNGPADHHLTRKLTWHHPALYFIILVALLIYAIVALCVQKKATVVLPLCDKHFRSRRKWVAIAWVTAMTGVALLIAGCMGLAASNRGNEAFGGFMMLAGLLMLVAGGIVGVIVSNPVKPAKIDDNFVTLKGVCSAYLAELSTVR